jgi:hypothetical protein
LHYHASEIRIMKKLIYISAIGLLLVGMSGCSRSWPSCFCNRNQSCPPAGCCESYESCDTCDPCSSGGFESYGGY